MFVAGFISDQDDELLPWGRYLQEWTHSKYNQHNKILCMFTQVCMVSVFLRNRWFWIPAQVHNA